MNGVMDGNYSNERQEKMHLVFRYKTRALLVCHAIREFLNRTQGLEVLDIGSADGLTLLEMEKHLPNSSFLGIEYSDALLETVKEMPDNIQVIKGDACYLSEKVLSKKYDVVTALAVLEHLPSPDKAMGEIKKVLRPGGILIATCPNPIWDAVSTKLGLLKDEQHQQEMNRNALMRLITDADMKLVTYRPFMWAPVGFLPYLKIPMSPGVALRIDKMIRTLKIFNWGFVNQCLVVEQQFGQYR